MTVEGTYTETETKRVIKFESGGRRVTVSVTREGYGMLIVADESGEVERYYGLDMALDHVAELLGVGTADLDVPEPAEDMGT